LPTEFGVSPGESVSTIYRRTRCSGVLGFRTGTSKVSDQTSKLRSYVDQRLMYLHQSYVLVVQIPESVLLWWLPIGDLERRTQHHPQRLFLRIEHLQCINTSSSGVAIERNSGTPVLAIQYELIPAALITLHSDVSIEASTRTHLRAMCYELMPTALNASNSRVAIERSNDSPVLVKNYEIMSAFLNT
jgi:hypothetical protein